MGRPARQAAVVKGIVAAVDVASEQYRVFPAGYPYATAIAVADELAATPTTKKLVAAVQVRHQRGQLVGNLR